MSTDNADNTKPSSDQIASPANDAAPATGKSDGGPMERSPGDPPASNAHSAPADHSKTGVRGRPFAPGQSGNPKGRPKGSLGWKARASKEILSNDLEDIMKAAIAAAKGGDTSMMKFCLTLGMNRKDDAIKVDVPKLDSLAACRDAIGKVVQDALQGDLLPSEARAALELIERRRSSFAETESQREFEREYVRELVLCMMAKYHLGIGDAIDIRTIHRFAEDLPKLGLPQTIHDRVFRTFLDHALKEVQKDTSFGKDMTAEALMTEIIMYSLSMERSKARIKEIGLEAYNREVAELLKNYKLKAMK